MAGTESAEFQTIARLLLLLQLRTDLEKGIADGVVEAEDKNRVEETFRVVADVDLMPRVRSGCWETMASDILQVGWVDEILQTVEEVDSHTVCSQFLQAGVTEAGLMALPNTYS